MLTSNFIFAGRAVFTCQSVTGEKITFRISKSKKYENGFNLYGKVNGSMTYIGSMVRGEETKMFLKSEPSYEKVQNVFKWSLDVISGKKTLKEGYDIHHEGVCGKCGRELTDPTSIKIGIGPTCRIHKKDKSHSLTFTEKFILTECSKKHSGIVDIYISNATNKSGKSVRVVFEKKDDLFLNTSLIGEELINEVNHRITAHKLEKLLGE